MKIFLSVQYNFMSNQFHVPADWNLDIKSNYFLGKKIERNQVLKGLRPATADLCLCKKLIMQRTFSIKPSRADMLLQQTHLLGREEHQWKNALVAAAL